MAIAVEKWPAATSIERQTIGAVLQYGSAMDDIRHLLTPDDFTNEDLRRVWRACCELYDAGGKIDYTMVYAHLDAAGLANLVGGLSFLMELSDGIPANPHVDRWAAILREKTVRRRMILAADHLAQRAADESGDIEGVLDSWQEQASGLVDLRQGDDSGPVSTAELIAQRGVDKLLGPKERGAVRLPWPSLDRALGGLSGGQMLVLMAATSRGKSSAALQIAAAAAIQRKTPLIWTMEMSPESMFRRLVAQIGGVRGGGAQLSFDEREAQRSAVATLNEHPIYFDGKSRSVSTFRSSIRRVKAKSGVGLVVVDYLQLIRSQSRGASRAQEVSDNSRSLKLAAMDFGVPFVVLSQVDRTSVKNGGEIGLHSAKESGDVENDADIVAWVKCATEFFRDRETPLSMWIGKQRENGGAGFGIPMVFQPQTQTFMEVDE